MKKSVIVVPIQNNGAMISGQKLEVRRKWASLYRSVPVEPSMGDVYTTEMDSHLDVVLTVSEYKSGLVDLSISKDLVKELTSKYETLYTTNESLSELSGGLLKLKKINRGYIYDY